MKEFDKAYARLIIECGDMIAAEGTQKKVLAKGILWEDKNVNDIMKQVLPEQVEMEVSDSLDIDSQVRRKLAKHYNVKPTSFSVRLI